MNGARVRDQHAGGDGAGAGDGSGGGASTTSGAVPSPAAAAVGIGAAAAAGAATGAGAGAGTGPSDVVGEGAGPSDVVGEGGVAEGDGGGDEGAVSSLDELLAAVMHRTELPADLQPFAPFVERWRTDIQLALE